ncbi:MAG: cell division protein FtsQ/DivIB [Candidatus Paceibacterota bacterium]
MKHLSSKRIKRRRFLLRLKYLFLFLFICSGLIALYWVIFYSSFFSLKKVKIVAPENFSLFSEEEVLNEIKQQNKKYLFLPKESLSFVFLSQEKLKENLKKNHAEIESIEARLNLQKGELIISYTVFTPQFNFCFLEKEECYYIDKGGIIFKKIEGKDSSLPTIFLKEGPEVILGQKILEKNKVEDFLEIIVLLKEKENLLNFGSFYLDKKDSPDFQLVTSEGMKIFLNFGDNYQEIFLILKELKEQQFQGKFNNIDYIDLRYLPKVYYKTFE